MSSFPRRSYESPSSSPYNNNSNKPSLSSQPIDHRDHHLDDHHQPNAPDEVVLRVEATSNFTSTSTINNNNNNNGHHHHQPHPPKPPVWPKPNHHDHEVWSDSSTSTNPPISFAAPDDPPSLLINAFLSKQRDACGEMALDMDLDMEELRRPPSPTTNASKDVRVSFREPSPEAASLLRRRSVAGDGPSSPSEDGRTSEDSTRLPPRPSGDGVLRCTSTAHRRASTLFSTRTRSRLVDPPPVREDPRATSIPRSGPARSTASQYEEDEEDPFAGEDAPPLGSPARSRLSRPVVVLEWASLFVILASLLCSLLVPTLAKHTVLNLHLWKWEVLVLVLICGRLVSGWVIRLVVFSIERNFLLRKRLLYFVYGVRKAVRNCIWLGLVLLAWHYLFDKRVERETRSKILPYVTKVLVCLLVTTVFRLVKTLLVKVLASSFHVSTYFDRIQESLFNQYLIEKLSGPPLVEALNAREEEEEGEEEERVMAEVQMLQRAGADVPADLKAAVFGRHGRVIGGSKKVAAEGGKSMKLSRVMTRTTTTMAKREEAATGITIEHLHRLNQKNVSAWNMKRLMNIVRKGALTTLDEHIMDASKEDESATKIRSEYEAKVAAKKIFNNVARPGAKYIYLIDLMRFLREDEAIKAMRLFDGAQESKRVGKSALKNWLVNAFRERRALSLTLNDTKTAVKKLHQMVNVVVGVVVLIIWLLILGIASTHVFVFLSSQLLLAVFIFGNSCKTTFEAIIFLFAMHPFDVGDRCEIDGVQMIVEEMNILTTIFLKYDGHKITYPNSVLSTKVIGNYYRSPDMGDAIDFCIHASTPVEKISHMKERIKRYIEGKPENWYPVPTVVLRDVEDMSKVRVSVWFQHRMNHQDMRGRWVRREQVLQEIIQILKELEIEYRRLPLDVNVRNMPAIQSTRLPSTWASCS